MRRDSACVAPFRLLEMACAARCRRAGVQCALSICFIPRLTSVESIQSWLPLSLKNSRLAELLKRWDQLSRVIAVNDLLHGQAVLKITSCSCVSVQLHSKTSDLEPQSNCFRIAHPVSFFQKGNRVRHRLLSLKATSNSIGNGVAGKGSCTRPSRV